MYAYIYIHIYTVTKNIYIYIYFTHSLTRSLTHGLRRKPSSQSHQAEQGDLAPAFRQLLSYLSLKASRWECVSNCVRARARKLEAQSDFRVTGCNHVRVCMCVYIYIYTYILQLARSRRQTNIYIYMCVCVSVCIYIYIHTYIYTCITRTRRRPNKQEETVRQGTRTAWNRYLATPGPHDSPGSSQIFSLHRRSLPCLLYKLQTLQGPFE